MKNELIIASYKGGSGQRASARIAEILRTFGLEALQARFFTPDALTARSD